MLIIKNGLPNDKKAVSQYIDAWCHLIDTDRSIAPHEVQRRLFDHMYGNLDILDSKTNSLIQLTAILVAAFAFVATMPQHRFDEPARALFVLGIIYAATAALLCLQVIWVHWSSLDDLDNAQQHMESLIQVRTRRTVRFRRAWTFAAVSLGALALLLLHETIFKIPISIGPLVGIVAFVHIGIVFAYDDLIILGRSFLTR